MSDLQVCQECQRHIKVSESACPFCGESNKPSRGPSRAAIFAGALVSATALGCGDSKPAVEGPGDTNVQAVEIDAMAASPVDTEENVDEGNEEEVETEPPPPPMPYGAPPARKRFV